MKTTFSVSPSYRAAMLVSIPQQVVVFALSLMALDFGEMKQICGMTFLAFWAGVGLIMRRRPLAPSRVDLLFIRLGFLPLFVAGYALVFLVWRLRGVA